jgi:hypothetical protein
LTAVPATGDQPPDFNTVPELPGHHATEITTHFFGIEGRVLEIHRDGPLLKSIKFQTIHPLPMAVGYQPYDGFGDEVEIHFDTVVTNFDQLGISANTIATVYFGGIDEKSGWVSNLAWVGFWKDGDFFCITAEQPTPAEPAPTTVSTEPATTQPSKKRRPSRQHIGQPDSQSLVQPSLMTLRNGNIAAARLQPAGKIASGASCGFPAG